jgi:hypothetical protein
MLLTLAPGIVAALLWYFGGQIGQAVVVGGIVYGIALCYATPIFLKAQEIAKEKYPGLFRE